MKAESFYASPQQEHLWALQQADNSLAYRSQRAVLINGGLDMGLLERALGAVVRRHEILRTTFRYLPEEARLIQRIAPTASLSLRTFSTGEGDIQDQEAWVSMLFDDLRRRPFDFENGPLLHVHIIELSHKRHVLLASISALCGDEATLSNLFIELSDAYSQGANYGRNSEEPLQYSDFARWQREALELKEAEVGRRYWRRQDFSLQPGLDLPFKVRRKERPAFELAAFPLICDNVRVERLKALSRIYETTPRIFLLTAWTVLLWRLTGRPDLVVGVSCDGRKYAELSNALGLMAGYLPLQCALEGGSKFEAVLKKLHRSAEDVYRWQESFSWEQTAESKPREAGEPFCAAGFEFIVKRPSRPFGSFSSSIVKRYECIERFEMKLSCSENDEGFGIELHFDSGLFQVGDVKRLGDRLQVLLEGVMADPKSRISELQILSELERHQLLVEFNDTEPASETDHLVHRLFEKQAMRTPEATAVVYEDQQVTYAALNRRANQLAHYLRDLGVGPESLVPLCVERGIDMMVGLLAVLKAGGAYVPLDAGYPKERLAYTLADCRAAVALTQRRLLKDLPQTRVRTICLDSEWEWIRPGSEAGVAVEVSPQNPVYVIYTSGSTGKPKGVVVEHRQLVNYCDSIAKKLDVFEGAGYTALSTLAADLGNTAIFPSLTTGGRLHIISPEIVEDASALGEYFENHHIDYLKITPSHLAAVQSSKGGGLVMPREKLVLGGEALPASLARQLKEKSSGCAIINHYGPTETTVGVLTHEVKGGRGAEDATANVPLGRPIAKALAYILDGALNVTPIGIAGEIHLGGEGLSRGYLNRPDTTAERFIPNPFVRKAGSRMYRTGDLARRLDDGLIDFLGRIDYQVKIRGFRIELGEIEAALIGHQAVRNAVVLAREDRPGTKRLVAYIEAKDGEVIRDEEMWSYLRGRLPEYMVPSEYVALRALPLMANGKVDRRALPAPKESGLEGAADFMAPRTEVEEQLARIWAEVLGLERVSVQANFFRLGGDSILSIQIVSRAKDAGYHLTARDIFEYQTIAELAGIVDRKSVPKAEQELVRGEVPLTPIQRRFFEYDFADPHQWNQSVLLEARQPLSAHLLEEALARLLWNHDALNLRFIRKDSTVRQINMDPDEVSPFAQVDLSALSEPRRTQVLESLADCVQASLNLSEGPLLRMILFNFGNQKPDCLLICIHHLVVDVFSWRILIEDIQAIYRRLCSGEPATLPAKTTSYRQWAHRLVERSESPDALRQADYWLADARQHVDALPVDYSGGINSEASARAVVVSLDMRETEALIREIPEVSRTRIDDVLLTALAQAFARWTGSQRLLVDFESHGRDELFSGVDLSRTVGWFTVIYPLLLDLGEWSEPGRTLKFIKEQRRRLPQQGIDYGLLRYLGGHREVAEKLRALPEAQVSFNYLGQFDQVFSGASLFAGATDLTVPNISPRAARMYLLNIIGRVTQGRLRFSFGYSENVHRRETIERLGRDFLIALRELITHCLTDRTGGVTPSDFPDVELTQEELDGLMTRFG